MDVEALSAELAREAAKREAAKVVIEAAIVVDLVEEVVEQLEVNNDPPEEGLLEASVASISELAEEVVPRSPVLGLNPAAAAFVPSWGAPAPEVVQPAVEALLSKSWAQIVVNGNGQAQEEVKVEEVSLEWVRFETRGANRVMQAVVTAVEDAATPVETVESPADPINEFVRPSHDPLSLSTDPGLRDRPLKPFNWVNHPHQNPQPPVQNSGTRSKSSPSPVPSRPSTFSSSSLSKPTSNCPSSVDLTTSLLFSPLFPLHLPS
jgi:hypothetical protein